MTNPYPDVAGLMEFRARLDASPRVGQCERCGADFEDRSARQNRRFCSDNCRKRQHDDEFRRGTCRDCGAITRHPGYERCRECHFALEARARQLRAEDLVEWWANGDTMAEIADRLGTTVNTLSVELHRLRAEGYDLPLRPPGGLRRAA